MGRSTHFDYSTNLASSLKLNTRAVGAKLVLGAQKASRKTETSSNIMLLRIYSERA